MAKQVYINLPITDLERATKFYEALGFTKNPDYSDENASAMMWSEDIVIMILTKEFYGKFLKDKQVVDTKTSNGVLLAFTLDSKEDVEKFVATAKANGGEAFPSYTPEGVTEEMMLSYEVLDPDGNQLEPVWMNPNFNPQA